MESDSSDSKQLKRDLDRQKRDAPRDCAVIYAEYLIVANSLNDRDRISVYAAILDLAINGVWPVNLKGVALAAFKQSVGPIQRGWKKSEAGRKGGRPRKGGEADDRKEEGVDEAFEKT